MSRALARLRVTTGDPLLVRAGRGLVPTRRALELRGAVGRLVQDAEAALRPAGLLDLGKLARIFTLRTSEGFVENFGPRLLARVGAEAPGVRLRFLQKTDRDSTMLRDGIVDLETGVVGETTGPEVRAQSLFRDRFIGVARKGHALGKGRITPARYAAGQHIFVSRRGRDTGPIDEALTALGLQRQIVAIVGGFATALALARRLRPDRQRSRTPHRQAARRHAEFCAAGRHAGDHGVPALAPAPGRRSGASLAARLRPGCLRVEEASCSNRIMTSQLQLHCLVKLNPPPI